MLMYLIVFMFCEKIEVFIQKKKPKNIQILYL